MPTIEIISVNAKSKMLNQTDYDFAIIEEQGLNFHRRLFQKDLDKIQGTIVHLGNPDMIDDKDGGFFAGQLINWDFNPGIIKIPNVDKGETGANQDEFFQFEKHYFEEIINIISIYIAASETNLVYFLTDYQFGPEKPKRIDSSFSNFCDKHNKEGLEWNCLFKINGT